MATDDKTQVPAVRNQQQPIALSEHGTLAPTTFEDAWRFSQMIASSDLVPEAYKNKPANCMIAMQMGAELGLAPMQSIQSIAVINGQPSVWGDGALGLVLRHRLVKDVQEDAPSNENNMTARCTVYRRDREPVSRTFSQQDAEDAGLWKKKGPWTNYPKRMIQLRARGFALRDSCADILRGLAIVEDVMDIEPEPVEQESLDDLNARIAAAGEQRAEGPGPDVITAKAGERGGLECPHTDKVQQGSGVARETVCVDCGEVLESAETDADLPANIPSRPTAKDIAPKLGNVSSADDLDVLEDLIREMTDEERSKIQTPLEAARKRVGRL